MARKWQIEMWKTLSAILGDCDGNDGCIIDPKHAGEPMITQNGVANPVGEAKPTKHPPRSTYNRTS